MLNKLAKNQYVKIIKSNLENSDIEYGVVLNDENEKYDIMSIGFENKNGKFVENVYFIFKNLNELEQNRGAML